MNLATKTAAFARAARFVGLALLLLAGIAHSAEPSYACNPAQGCVEERGAVHDIGRGAKLTLPDGWTYFSYPTAPIPVMAGLREIRAFKDGIVIAISPFPNIDQRAIDEDWLRDRHAKGLAGYVDRSRERSIEIVSMSHDELVGCYASFTAANENEKPFFVLPNRRHASVTSFLISYRFVIFSVSLASERPPDDAYEAALSAIRNLR